MRRILIATDGSPAGVEAASVGVDLAAAQGAAVTFVHVVPPAFETRPGRLAAATRVQPRPVHDDEVALKAAAELAHAVGVDANVAIVSGDASDEIVAYADTIDADVIIVGSRGRNAVTSALLGSVSRGVLHEARRPVLIVPRSSAN
jgi:nucleotide-binding universal stress UspA family protein